MSFAFPERLHPTLGRFYRAASGQVWCCYRSRLLVKPYGDHTQSFCVRVSDHVQNYFLDDRSCDPGGEIDQVLVVEVGSKEAQQWAEDNDPLR